MLYGLLFCISFSLILHFLYYYKIDNIFHVLNYYKNINKCPEINLNIDIESVHNVLNNLKIFQPHNNNLIFIKTHKTGGSTLNGILWRKLCGHNNCFIPDYHHPGKIWDFSKRNDLDYMHVNEGTKQSTAPYSVWLNHVKMNDVFIHNVTIKSKYGFKFISIVRRYDKLT